MCLNPVSSLIPIPSTVVSFRALSLALSFLLYILCQLATLSRQMTLGSISMEMIPSCFFHATNPHASCLYSKLSKSCRHALPIFGSGCLKIDLNGSNTENLLLHSKNLTTPSPPTITIGDEAIGLSHVSKNIPQMPHRSHLQVHHFSP